MSNIALFKLNQQPQYLRSVSTGDYIGNNDAIINPDVLAIQSVPLKYWKRSGDTIVEMTQAEKDAITAEELLNRKAQADNFNVSLKNVFTAFLKVYNSKFSIGKRITKQEMIDALKEEIT